MKKILASTLVISLLFTFGYLFFEPEIVKSANPDEITVSLTVTASISMTEASNIEMDRVITATANTAAGRTWTAWNVKTNDKDGYHLAVKASQTSAMFSADDTIEDYDQATTSGWTVNSGYAKFGFSIFGDDVSVGWGTDTSTCTSADYVAQDTNRYWRGFNGANDIAVANRTSTTTTSGSDATLCVSVEQHDFYIPDGTYTATITATATVN